jgi:hypothetical protein
MLSDRDLNALLDFAEGSPWRLADGGWVVVDVSRCDVTEGKPFGLAYRLVVHDAQKRRVLGFDNSHGPDDAPETGPFDHEHPHGRVDRRIAYTFASASGLLTDFFERLESYCAKTGIPFELEPRAAI